MPFLAGRLGKIVFGVAIILLVILVLAADHETLCSPQRKVGRSHPRSADRPRFAARPTFQAQAARFDYVTPKVPCDWTRRPRHPTSPAAQQGGRLCSLSRGCSCAPLNASPRRSRFGQGASATSPGAGSEPAGFGEDIALLFDGYLAMGTRSGQASGIVLCRAGQDGWAARRMVLLQSGRHWRGGP